MITVLLYEREEASRLAHQAALTKQGFTCRSVATDSEVIPLLDASGAEVVIVDVDGPSSSWTELVHRTATESPDTGIVAMGSRSEAVEEALRLGASAYLVHPFRLEELGVAIRHSQTVRSLLKARKESLETIGELTQSRAKDLIQVETSLERARLNVWRAEIETVRRLAKAAELKSEERKGHIERVGAYSGLIAQRLGVVERKETIQVASLLHDVGKLGVPDKILRKRGKLTDEDRVALDAHTIIGHEILSGSEAEVLQVASAIALSHHERFDGSGYPRGLAGEDIPLEARILAVADSFDALTSGQAHRPAIALGVALNLLREGRASQFEPQILDAFLESLDDVLELRSQYPD